MPRTRAAQDRHNELRRRSRGKARKAIFIADYVEVKYSNIFKEAEGLFNMLNEKYKDKHDLRKTDEFLFFKLTMEGKYGKDGKKMYFGLETATACESLPLKQQRPAKVSQMKQQRPAKVSQMKEQRPAKVSQLKQQRPAKVSQMKQQQPAKVFFLFLK